MSNVFDLLIKGGQVIDPVNKRSGRFDVGIKDGKVIEVCDTIDSAKAGQVLRADGMLVIPGIVDIHTHLSARHHGACGHKMLVKAGVTTTLEIAGPIDSVLPIAGSDGVGINMAMLNQVHPGVTVKDNNPSAAELEDLIERTLDEGGIGIKLLGGHFPITPASIKRAIEASYKKQSYIAFHAGSTETGSNIDGALEAIALADGKPLHLAHVNSYCRGYVRDCVEEADQVIAALIANPNIRAESYLSPMNGCSSFIVDGRPESKVTQKCLERGGYEATAAGMEVAMLDGWGKFNMLAGGENILCSGLEAVAAWRKSGTVGSMAFAVNPIESRVRLAGARRPDGSFVVDCIATDGGGHVRNVIVACGLPLIRLGAFSIQDFVMKASRNPAKWLGLEDKGHLGVGADADITIIDENCSKAMTTIIGGEICMHQGAVFARKTKIITTERGRKAIEKCGLAATVIDLAKTAYFNGM